MREKLAALKILYAHNLIYGINVYIHIIHGHKAGYSRFNPELLGPRKPYLRGPTPSKIRIWSKLGHREICETKFGNFILK